MKKLITGYEEVELCDYELKEIVFALLRHLNLNAELHECGAIWCDIVEKELK